MSIPIVGFAKEAHALTLIAYYKELGIYAELNKKSDVNVENSDLSENVSAESQLFEVLIYDNAQYEQAVSIARDYVAAPNSSKFQQAAWQFGSKSTSKESLFAGIELESLKDWRKSIFTHFIGVLCVTLYALMSIGYTAEIYSALQIQYFSKLAENHQWWRLLGPNFMHGSTFHLLANMMWWWLLAGKLERTLGRSSLIILFIVSSLVSNIAQLLYSGPNFVGLSGVVYALFGFMWVMGRLRPSWGLSLPNGIIGLMLIWLVVGYADLLWVSMANEAHTFGLITGCLLALLLHKFTDYQARKAK